MSIRNEKIKVYEMTCTSCENKVEKSIMKLEGVSKAKANYSGQFIIVSYNENLCTLPKIKDAITKAGYSTYASNDYKLIGIFIVVATVVLLGMKTSGFDMDAKLTNASYLVLFIVGILTSIHCVGMCGGIMLSQSLSIESTNKFESIKPSLFYNLGRVISYTILGGIIGTLGSVFSISITAKAILQLFAGLFMILMGFNIASFSIFRKFNIKLPNSICRVKNKSTSPFIVGILNALMPCGPLQTMQLFALGTGSATKGALSMFMFSIGTVPLMLTFGALSGLLTKGYTKKILKISGVLIIVLGLIMGNRGLALVGVNINPITLLSSPKNLLTEDTNSFSNSNISKSTIENGVQVINMTADNNGYTPNAFYVQKGIPVKWIIDGKQLNSCNNAIVVKSLNKQEKIKSGENIIEFTPEGKDINFSCWMGMITGVIKVVDNLDDIDISKSDSSIPPASNSPSCCAVPVSDDSGSSSDDSKNSSIYGTDLSLVPTEVLINKAIVSENYQSANLKGAGYELQPLIVVTENNLNTKLTFDLSSFNNIEGKYLISDAKTGDTITTFTAKKGINEVEFNPRSIGIYTITKDKDLLGIIEVVDNLNTTNLEEIRGKYIK